MTSLPIPKPGAHDILIQLDAAGIGVWDPAMRAGEFEVGPTTFPKVIGNDGAGTVVAVGGDVKRFQVGSRVYAYSMEGGFYAEYVAVSEDNAASTPPSMNAVDAGALGADGITALRGLDVHLKLVAGLRLMIFGASGGIGHLAAQLAKRMGAQVFAVASGTDGVDLVKRLGADGGRRRARTRRRPSGATVCARGVRRGARLDERSGRRRGAGAREAWGALRLSERSRARAERTSGRGRVGLRRHPRRRRVCSPQSTHRIGAVSCGARPCL